MPFQSKAQIQKFVDLHKAGKIGLGTIAHWALNTPDIQNLPERKDKPNADNPHQQS